MPSPSCVVEFVELQGDFEAVFRRELFDQPAHLSVADDGKRSSFRLHEPSIPLEDVGIELSKEFLRAALSTVRTRSASATTKLRFSSEAPCEIMRTLMSVQRAEDRAATPGV